MLEASDLTMFTRHAEVSLDLNRACISLVRAVRPGGGAEGMSVIASLIDVRLAALEARDMAPWTLMHVGRAGTAHECVLRRKTEDRLVSHTRNILAGPGDAIVVHDCISNAGSGSMEYVWDARVRPGAGIGCRVAANPLEHADSMGVHHPWDRHCRDSLICVTAMRWEVADASPHSPQVSDAPCDRPLGQGVWSVGSGQSRNHMLVLRGPRFVQNSCENDLYEHLDRLTNQSGT